MGSCHGTVRVLMAIPQWHHSQENLGTNGNSSFVASVSAEGIKRSMNHTCFNRSIPHLELTLGSYCVSLHQGLNL